MRALIPPSAPPRQVYYETKRTRQRQEGRNIFNNGYDDENYDYILVPDETLNGRYQVQKRLGKVRRCPRARQRAHVLPLTRGACVWCRGPSGRW